MRIGFIACLLLVATFGLYAQIQRAEGVNQVEFEPFSPPIKETIEHWELKPAKNFMGLDLNGKSHTLSSMKGSKVAIFFLSLDHPMMDDMISVINSFQSEYPSLKVLAAIYEDKARVASYFSSNSNNLTIMHSCKFLSEAVYEDHLGAPRMFLIDEKGVTQKVIPASIFEEVYDKKLFLLNTYSNAFKI